jgi:hypothetical protein
MRHYLSAFAFKNVDSQQFKATFCDFFKDTPASECKLVTFTRPVAGRVGATWPHKLGGLPSSKTLRLCVIAVLPLCPESHAQLAQVIGMLPACPSMPRPSWFRKAAVLRSDTSPSSQL